MYTYVNASGYEQSGAIGVCMSTEAAATTTGALFVDNYTDAMHWIKLVERVGYTNGTGNMDPLLGYVRTGNTAIRAMRIYPTQAGSNFDAGTIALYGIK